jgi:hypothetical protein
VVTDVFAAKSRLEAEALGVPELPLVVLPHPVGQRSPEEIRDLTDAALASIEAALKGRREVTGR